MEMEHNFDTGFLAITALVAVIDAKDAKAKKNHLKKKNRGKTLVLENEVGWISFDRNGTCCFSAADSFGGPVKVLYYYVPPKKMLTARFILFEIDETVNRAKQYGCQYHFILTDETVRNIFDYFKYVPNEEDEEDVSRIREYGAIEWG